MAVMEKNLIEQILEETGLSQVELAERVGCKKSMINLIKAGKRRPSPELAARFQAATGIDARRLLGIKVAQ